MNVHLLSNIVSIELDSVTGWVKITRVTGELLLIQPRDLLALMAWSQGNAQALVASQRAIDQEASLSANPAQGQTRPVRLVEALPTEPTSLPEPSPRKRKRRRPLPLPIIQISQALPCLLCTPTTMTMTAIVDLNADRHAPWPLYSFCPDHLRHVLAEREATGGLSLHMIVQRLLQTPPS